MFTALHALAKSATLMIVIGAEDDQLRVSITPTQSGDKSKPHALRPLSLLATPAELDADFATALAIWQAPKRTLIEQAQAAAGESADTDDGEETTTSSAPAPAKKSKVGRPKKSDAPAGEPECAPAAEKSQDSAPAPAAAQPPAAAEFTLDLF